MTQNNRPNPGSSSNSAGRPVVDWNEALERVAHDEEILFELVEIFLDQWPQVMDEIEQSVARGDHVTLRRAAHTLKGSASIFGAWPVVDVAEELSEMGKNNRMRGADDALRELQDEVERLVPELRDRLPSGNLQ